MKKLGAAQKRVMQRIAHNPGLTGNKYIDNRGDQTALYSLLKRGLIEREQRKSSITNRKYYSYHITSAGNKYVRYGMSHTYVD